MVTIDKFENPSGSQAWTKALATKNNWGSADVVLVIATETRQAYFMAGSTKTLSSDQQTKVYQNYVKPKLQNSDYSGAALAAVEGIEAQKGGSSSGVVTGVLGLGAVAAVGGGVYAVRRRRRRSRPPITLPGRFRIRRSRRSPWRSYAPEPVVPYYRLTLR